MIQIKYYKSKIVSKTSFKILNDVILYIFSHLRNNVE